MSHINVTLQIRERDNKVHSFQRSGVFDKEKNKGLNYLALARFLEVVFHSKRINRNQPLDNPLS